MLKFHLDCNETRSLRVTIILVKLETNLKMYVEIARYLQA